MYLVTTALFLLLTAPALTSEKEPTHCDDPAVWTDWQEKATQQTGNLDFQTLHALWMGLCMKVKNGGLTADEADTVFERARETLIEQRREEQRRRLPPTF